MMRNIKLLILTTALIFIGCTSSEKGSEIGQEFYRENAATQSERLTKYSFSDQWEIYYYAKTAIHPPDFSLSKYLASNGEPMASFILNFLNSSKEDMYFLNSLDVLDDMKFYNYFDYCKDVKIVEKMNSNKNLIKDSGWREIYSNKRLRMDC